MVRNVYTTALLNKLLLRLYVCKNILSIDESSTQDIKQINKVESYNWEMRVLGSEKVEASTGSWVQKGGSPCERIPIIQTYAPFPPTTKVVCCTQLHQCFY